jgi:hypothetical protein
VRIEPGRPLGTAIYWTRKTSTTVKNFRDCPKRDKQVQQKLVRL